MIIEYLLVCTIFDSVNGTVIQTWQYGLPHNPEILGTFTGTESELQAYLKDIYTS
jgi:hypothetical protein